MRHAIWLFSFVSAVGFAQSIPNTPLPPAGPTEQVKPKFLGPKNFVWTKPGSTGAPMTFLSGPILMAAPMCAVPLIHAPLGNTEPMPVSKPPVISRETELMVPAPACDEPLNAK